MMERFPDRTDTWRGAFRGALPALVVLAVLAFGLYANTLDNDFVLDDTSYIRDNYLLRDLGNLPKFFNIPDDALWEDQPAGFLRGRNIRWVTYAVDHALGGGAPWVFHLSNILWHLAVGAALFFLLRRWFSGPRLALWAAAFFLAHPVQTAAVAYISGRKDLLCAAFILLTLLAVERLRASGRPLWWPAAAASLFLAYYSKEVAAVFPVLLLWCDFCRDGQRPAGQSLRHLLRRHGLQYALFSLMAGIFVWRAIGARLLGAAKSLLATVLSGPPVAQALAAGPGGETLAAGVPNLSYANLTLFYLGKLLCPSGLLADYKGAFDFSLYPAAWGGVVSPLFALTLLALLLWLRRRWAEGALGLGWIVITLLPVSQLVPFHYPAAIHYLYVPAIGFAILLGSLAQRLRPKHGRAALVGVLTLLTVYGVATVRRNGAWQDMESLTLDILAQAPAHPRANSTLVHLYMEQGRSEEALAQALSIQKLLPGSAVNHYNLGVIYEEQGAIDSSVRHYRRAIALKATFWDAYLNLGNLLLVHGRRAEGEQVFAQLLSRYGYHPLAFWSLGNDRARQGDWSGALEKYRRAVAIDPGGAAGRLGVAGALWSLGQVPEARLELERALEAGLDLDWVRQHEPWKTFLQRPEVVVFLEPFN